jgi:FkbM family methyltransferase
MKTKFENQIFQINKRDFVKGYEVNNLKYALFPNDDAITKSIIQGWQYQQYMFDFFSFNHINLTGKDIIDVGANNGNFAIDFAHMVGDNGKVHAFEPQRIIYYQLCGNVFINGIDNIICKNYAIGEKEGVVEIEVPNYYEDSTYVNFGNVHINNGRQAKKELVEMKMVDSFEFNDVAFIKIDVQGYEPFVIDGAANTILKHRPFMMVEFEQPNLELFGSNEEKLMNKIRSLGYELKRMHEGVNYGTYNNGLCADFICIPEEKISEIVKIP